MGLVLYFPLLLRLGYGPTVYHIHPPKIAKQLNQTPRLQLILETAISAPRGTEEMVFLRLLVLVRWKMSC